MLQKRSGETWAIYCLALKTISFGQVTAPDEDKGIKAAIKQLPLVRRVVRGERSAEA